MEHRANIRGGLEPAGVMPQIMISYRREDSGVITGRIFDRLVARYGRGAIFRDIDNIPLGVDFRAHLDEVLGASDVVLAIVGPQWVGSSDSDNRFAMKATQCGSKSRPPRARARRSSLSSRSAPTCQRLASSPKAFATLSTAMHLGSTPHRILKFISGVSCAPSTA